MTTKAKHAPEPWLPWADHPGDKDCPLPMGRDDYERARACVNACAGIPTEQLEAGCVRQLVTLAYMVRNLRDSPMGTAYELPAVLNFADEVVGPLQKDSKS